MVYTFYLVLYALRLDIGRYSVFISMITDYVDIESFGPELLPKSCNFSSVIEIWPRNQATIMNCKLINLLSRNIEYIKVSDLLRPK